MPANLFIALIVCLLSATAIASNEEPLPDLALLEFLGSFETPDGKWVDPMEIENMLDEENALANQDSPKKEGGNDE